MREDFKRSLYEFARNNRYFLFNKNTGCFFEISKHLFISIQEYKNGNIETFTQDAIACINSACRASSRNKNAVSSTRDNLFRLRFEISNLCNNKCRYCHVFNVTKEKLANKFINFEDVKRLIIEFLEVTSNYQSHNSYYINFYGGEPLLAWETINKIVSFFKNNYKGKKILWSINSNGRLFTEEIACFFKKYNIELHVGCDGPQKINDKLRISNNNTGTFYEIIRASEEPRAHARGIKT